MPPSQKKKQNKDLVLLVAERNEKESSPDNEKKHPVLPIKLDMWANDLPQNLLSPTLSSSYLSSSCISYIACKWLGKTASCQEKMSSGYQEAIMEKKGLRV